MKRFQHHLGLGMFLFLGFLAFVAFSKFVPTVQAADPLYLPAGFIDEVVVTGLLSPRAFAFAPDGRIFITETGSATSPDINFASIRVVQNGVLLSTRALTIDVCGDGERGLLGLALDPNFPTNGYIYLYYTRQATSGAPCAYGTYAQGLPGPRNRVSRFTMTGNTADPASERVLLDNIATDSGIHNAGDLHFGSDGYLYISVGDAGMNPTPADNTASLNGKILRILPTSGPAGGYTTPGNPFEATANSRYCGTTPPQTGSGSCKEVFAYGFRNPFRFSIRPGTSTLYVGDVGGGVWEEISEVVAGGHHGYPVREGPCPVGVYCSLPQPPSGYVDPIHGYPHVVINANVDSAVIGGPIYTGTGYPTPYQNALFYGDFVRGWIHYLTYDSANNSWTDHDFASGNSAIIGLRTGLDGNLYYLTLSGGNESEVRRIRYETNVNVPPVAHITVDPLNGPLSTVYTFSATNSFDPDANLPLTHHWDFGDGSNQTTLVTTITKTYTLTGTKTVTLTVTDSGTPPLTSAPETVTVYPGNMSPTGSILMGNVTDPARTTGYYAGDTWSYLATNVNDDEPLPPNAYLWDVVFHHSDHSHPFLSNQSGLSGQFSIPTTGEPSTNVWYRVALHITDAQGQTTTLYQDVHPITATVTVDTNPSGGVVFVDGASLTAPQNVSRVVGFLLSLGVPSPQQISGTSYLFSAWSQGGAQNQTIAMPAGNGSFVADMAAVTPTPSPTLPPATPTPTATPVPPTHTPTPTSVPVVTLLVNGGLEMGSLSSWENNSGITVGSAAAYSGSFGAQMATTGRIDQRFNTTVGQTYYVSARIRINQQLINPSWGGLRVQIVNANWTQLAVSPSFTTANSPAGQWTRVYFSFVANTTQSRLIYQNFSGGGQFNASADEFIVSPNPIPDTPQATATPLVTPTFTPNPTATATPIPPTPTSTPTPLPPTATSGPTATTIPPTDTPEVTATPGFTATPTPLPTATMPSAVAILEPFEQVEGSWLVFRDSSGTGNVMRTDVVAAAGTYSTQLATTNGGSAAARVNMSVPAGSWGEYPGTWRWQWANVYLPATTIAQLGPTEYITVAGFWANGQNNRGWYLRVRQGGELYAYGFTSGGNPVEFRLYGTFPTDQWVDLEIGLHSQNGPGIKRGFAFLLNGAFYGWYNQGNLNGETFDRTALGILSTNSSDPLNLYVDEWRVLTTDQLPGGPDNRPTGDLQEQDFRTQSGVQWQIDWSSWEWDLRLHPIHGLYSANNRMQGGRNLDRMSVLNSGWGEIEIGWPNGTPPPNPNSYFGPMIGFRKYSSLEENLEVIPIGLGNGQVNLALEAWVNGGPIILAQWPLPLASIGGNSHIPEAGDVIRVRWEQTGTTLNVWGSYFDASSNTWYNDIISHMLTLTNVGGINFDDGRHTGSSITTDSQYYSIRRYTVGTIDSFPGTPTPTPTDTPLPPTPTDTLEPTFTPTLSVPTATDTPLPPTVTDTPEPTFTPTLPVPTATDTPLPPTPTNTLEPTFTLTLPVPTATNTSLPPTATNTLESTFTPTLPVPTATDTPLPPTATNTPEPTFTPTLPVPTATDTPLPPTATDTPEPTFTPTLPVPTATDTPLPPTPTNTPEPTFTPTLSVPTATNTPLPPTPTATPGTVGFPLTGILDTFNRANGGIGSNWSGSAGGYAINANLLDVNGGNDIYWLGSSFGADQEVYVTLVGIDAAAAEIDLILKSQSTAYWGNGLIEVWYHPASQIVQVWTFAPSQGWLQHGASIPVTFANGDQFGARATADGQVSVYRNGVLLANRSITSWAFATGTGYIGLWMANANNTLLDSFGGGTVITGPTPTPTHTPIPTPTNTPLPPTTTNTPGPTPTATLTPIPTPTIGGNLMYLSSTTGGTVSGIAFADEDILTYNTGTGVWSLYFDGSDVGLGSVDVSSWELMGDGSVLFSVDAPVTLATVGAVDDSDIIRFTPTSTGSTTAGTFSWYFDGSDVGLDLDAEEIDALDVLANGQIIISTTGSFAVTGASGLDEDLIAFAPTSLGDVTAGTWSFYFDGSDVGLANTNNEEITNVWVAGNGDLYLSALGAFTVTGVTGDGADVFRCVPGSLGSVTTCTFNLVWDGSLNGFAGEVLDVLVMGQS